MTPRDQTVPAESPQDETAAESPRDEENADVGELGYEEAREELTAIVAQLESGRPSLEESMRLWRRGEALFAHCSGWLDRAQAQIEQTTGPRD